MKWDWVRRVGRRVRQGVGSVQGSGVGCMVGLSRRIGKGGMVGVGVRIGVSRSGSDIGGRIVGRGGWEVRDRERV